MRGKMEREGKERCKREPTFSLLYQLLFVSLQRFIMAEPYRS